MSLYVRMCLFVCISFALTVGIRASTINIISRARVTPTLSVSLLPPSLIDSSRLGRYASFFSIYYAFLSCFFLHLNMLPLALEIILFAHSLPWCFCLLSLCLFLWICNKTYVTLLSLFCCFFWLRLKFLKDTMNFDWIEFFLKPARVKDTKPD